MSSSARLAIVTTSYPSRPGDASGHFVRTRAAALANAGHDVTVIAPGARSGELRDANGARVVRVADGGAAGFPGILPRLAENPLRAAGLVRFALGARRELGRRGPFDRLIAEWLVPSAFPIAAFAALGARLEVVVHGSDARLLERLPRPVSRGILATLIRRGARFSCVSRELAEILTRLAGRSLGAELGVEPAPIDVGGAPSRAEARARLGLAPDRGVVVVIGRLIAGKRTREALAAATLVPGACVVAVGDGPELARLCAEFPGVRYEGRLERERALCWIAAADAVLSASATEGAPTALREARALGVRVVSVAAGDLSQLAERDPGLFILR